MNNSQEILHELKAISPLLAGLEKMNLLQVPEGYFNELHLRITEFVMLDNKPSAVDNIAKTNLQQVPGGYFDSLSDSILAKVKAAYPQENAEEELSNLSPLLYSLKGKNVFSVPAGYFESFTEEVVSKATLSYSENAEEELRKLSPVLYALKGDNVFAVPRGYFESLSGNIIEKVKPQPAKIISMKRNSWLKYAAAAVVTGAIAVSSLLIFNNSSRNINGAPVTAVSASLPDYVKASFEYKTEAQINEGIAKLSDDDIAKYLEKNGNALDNELLINNTDVSELPSQTDYLKDENALNEYLDKIDAETDPKTKL